MFNSKPNYLRRISNKTMPPTKRPPFLRLIHSFGGPREVAPESKIHGRAQDVFLPSNDPGTLVFIAWNKSSADDLLDIFELSKPRIIFDLRLAPHFDLTLSRKRFFDLLRNYGCQYADILGRMGVSTASDALVNPTLIAGAVTKFVSASKGATFGPFVFLHDDDIVDDAYVTQFAKALGPTAVGSDWQVYRPQRSGNHASSLIGEAQPIEANTSDPTPLVRQTIFISHATPQDNAFVMWLSSKLSAAGYRVWSDITELNGGDVFWGSIEEMIRLHAAKVVFVHSMHVKGKSGVRKEVYLALKVADRNRLQRFVVPVRIDATPFDETLIELIDVQAIDCRHDWLVGLRNLIAVLQRDGVPRDNGFRADQFRSLISAFNQPASKVVQSSEELTSNWLPLLRHPQQVNFFSCQPIPTNQLPGVAARLSVPAFAYFTHIATTATRERLVKALYEVGYTDLGVSERASLSWEDFVAARYGDLPSWTAKEARSNAFAMLHKAWSLFVKSRGAISADLSNNRAFWFFADKHFANNEVRFLHFSGRTVRRQLTGYSAKRRVHWHFGTQARAALDRGIFHLVLTPHVTFSADGKTPLQSKAQLHSLRRSFCRSWWNDRWRDLLRAFVIAVSEGRDVIQVDVGGLSPIDMATDFSKFSCPVSLSDADTPVEETDTVFESEEDDEWEEGDYEFSVALTYDDLELTSSPAVEKPLSDEQY